jgi:hypothetical protein
LSQIVNFLADQRADLKKAKISLQFKENKADKDLAKWKGKITIGAGASLAGIPVTVDVGGATRSFVLDEKGKGDDGAGSKFRLKAKLDKNGLTKADTVKFSFQLRGDLKSTLAEYGLVDATVKKVPVTVPVSFTAAGPRTRPTGTSATAKEGKSGTAEVVL